PKATYIVPAFILLILLGRRLSIPVWLWWCWGALTLVWSVAPGASHATILWEITYLAAFAAAWWRPAVWFAAVYVIANGLADQLALSTFGLAQYMSGSVHYVAGA